MTSQLSPAKLFLFVALFFSFLIPLSIVSAQNTNLAGIGLSPATIENSANPGETQQHQVTVTNLSGSQQTYYLYMRDISGVTDGGTPIFADENAEKTGFELTQWLTLDKSEMLLAPGESTVVTVSIAVPENATPGSHFGGIFVTTQAPKLRETGAAVSYEVADIISIRVAGDAVENAQIRSFSTGNFIYSKPLVDFSARVENKGTVLVRPIGPLEIYNMFGKRVALVTFNDTKGGVFPGTEREFKVTWENDGPGFGRYQAILSLVYGDQGRQSTISSTATFWILPMNIILPAAGVLLFLLLVAYLLMRMYVNRTVRMLSGGSRRLVRRRRSGMSAMLLVIVVMLAVTALFLIILLALFA
jgi:hypothetical protein